ncbi:unnamed protein product, partial [Mesorhabditis spiculigera]
MALFSGPPVSKEAIFSIDRVKLYAETVGLAGTSGEDKLTPHAYKLLSEELTEIMKKIIIDAKKYATHARRRCVRLEDIERACRDRNFQAPLGNALSDTRHLKRHNSSSTGPFYGWDDAEIDITSYLNRPLIKFPAPMRIRCHWLAYEGVVQPVPENIVPYREDAAETEDEEAAAGKLIARRDTAKIIPKSSATFQFRDVQRGIKCQEVVAVRPLPPAMLSVEKQAYLKSVMEACVGAHDPLRVSALHSLETDTGLQDGLPILANIIQNGIKANVVHRCLSLLIYLVRVIRSLAMNKSLSLDPVLHQFLPSLLTCCISSSLCGRPESDNHWALRDFASKTLVIVVNSHLKTIPTVRDRVVQVLRKTFIDSESSDAMIYGSVLPLCDLTTATEKADLIARFDELMDNCRRICPPEVQPHDLQTLEAAKLLAVLSAMDGESKPSSLASTSHAAGAFIYDSDWVAFVAANIQPTGDGLEQHSRELAADCVNSRLIRLISMAKRFAIHARRSTLIPEDIALARSYFGEQDDLADANPEKLVFPRPLETFYASGSLVYCPPPPPDFLENNRKAALAKTTTMTHLNQLFWNSPGKKGASFLTSPQKEDRANDANKMTNAQLSTQSHLFDRAFYELLVRNVMGDDDATRELVELMPPILSCILAKKLSDDPTSDEHWALRRFSAQIVAILFKHYDVADFHSRTIKALAEPWEENANAALPTLYGSLYTLTRLGIRVMYELCSPHLASVYDRLKPLLESPSYRPETDEAQVLLKMIYTVFAEWVIETRPPKLCSLDDFEQHFGEQLGYEIHRHSLDQAVLLGVQTRNLNMQRAATSRANRAA